MRGGQTAFHLVNGGTPFSHLYSVVSSQFFSLLCLASLLGHVLDSMPMIYYYDVVSGGSRQAPTSPWHHLWEIEEI